VIYSAINMPDSVIWSTLATTIKAVSTVLVIYIGGYILVKAKLIDRKGVKLLASLSNYLFIPALLLLRLSGTLSLETFKYAWPLTLIGIGSVLFNLLFAFLCLPIAQPTTEFRPWFLLAISLPNTVAVPLVLIASICNQIEVEVPAYYLEAEAFEVAENSTQAQFLTVSQCIDIGELYIFLYSILITLSVWALGIPLLDMTAREKPREDPESQSNQIVPREQNSGEEEIYDSDASADTKQKRPSHFKVILKQLTQPAVTSQFLGLLIGLTAPLQNLFFGPGAVLSSITASVQIIAGAALSIINLITAVSLSFKIVELESIKILFGDEERFGVSRRTLLSLMVGRMIILPLIGIGVFYVLGDKLIPDDKLMLLVCFLEFSNPTANFVILIAQILERSRIGEIVALCVLPQYLVGIFTISGFTFASLLLADVN